MKKEIAAALTAAAILSSFTSCNKNITTQSHPPNQSSPGNADTSATAAEASCAESDNTQTTDYENSTNSTMESDHVENVRAIYGEIEIPDIPCKNGDEEGKTHGTMEDDGVPENCLDSIVLETHTSGQYKISLVAENVRTDKENFPGIIFARKLRIEAEKNGTAIESCGHAGYYCNMLLGVPQFPTDFRIFEDKIGSYTDLYELDDPVIAMRYFYNDDPERTVKKAIDFAIIHNNELTSGFFALSGKGTGIVLDSYGDFFLGLNSKRGEVCRMSIFSADEFEVLDSKTLLDNAAGIKYTFNFSDPPKTELYVAENVKIDKKH